ncbi:hypothetical protein NP511_02630 [Natrinema thermotolerans]|uniref:Uncharacterized protein n=1 Tax=Natrinema thermotolerans TaxID=121872 RepID=A0AAF0T2Q1_9EURY|nr:hypothetical protein [Natrinema thermotolerans]QCC57461.1 hypothetical protein DVR14_01915 [Natrinema thermotolerans]WMT08537.1 hypothetical protein NP511_02630 [Natrinema thermotolerans]
MVDFFERLSILLGSATVLAVCLVLLASGLLELGLDRRLRSGLVPSLGLLVSAATLAVWDASNGDVDDP